MRILLTGHTGFKGVWFSMIAKSFGHEVFGFSDEFTEDSLYSRAGFSDLFELETFGDVRKFSLLEHFVADVQPDVLVHMAAQPLVSEGYLSPMHTIETNVMGTVNVVLVAQKLNLGRTLVVTSDKVYDQQLSNEPKRESDALGGIDPYSSSKAAADLLAQALGNSFPNRTEVTVVRAGNVIGGGDHNKNRLLVDLGAAWRESRQLVLRNPNQIRPWQHVLDCSYSYLQLLEMKRAPAAVNLGPNETESLTVSEVIEHAVMSGLESLKWAPGGDSIGKETAKLSLDTSLASSLGICNKLSQKRAVEMTVDWLIKSQNIGPRDATLQQVDYYLSLLEPKP